MLSFTRGDIPIAKIEGGEFNNKILKIFKEEESDSDDEPDLESQYPMDYIDEDYLLKLIPGRNNRDKKFNKIEPLKRALASKDFIIPKDLKPYLSQAKTKINTNLKNELKLNKGELIPMPREIDNQVEFIYIGGPSGSGKSTYAGNYINFYKKMFPKNKVYLFSPKDEDPELDRNKINRIVIDEGLLEDPMTVDEFKNSLVVFDDIKSIIDKKLKKEVERVRDMLLNTGRSSNVYVITTNHQLTDYKETRDQINEASAITFFPGALGHEQIKYVLGRKLGLQKDLINKILTLPSRWVTLYKRSNPKYILHEKGAFLI